MIVTVIVAMDEGRGIGFRNRVLWHLSSDLKRFKEVTLGHFLIMGRKTFESIGKPLPGRQIIVVSRNPDYRPPGVRVAASLEQALQMAEEQGENEVFIVGGEQIFIQAMPWADRIYLTRVQARLKADTFFPEYGDEWVETVISRHNAGEKDEYPFSISLLVNQRKTLSGQN